MMPELAPDIYSPSVHAHREWETPRFIAGVARSMYRERRLAVTVTPRQHAKNFLRKELLRSGKTHILNSLDSHTSSAYFMVEIGPTCGGLPRSKIKAKVYGHKEQVFSTVELISEIELERRQPVLV